MTETLTSIAVGLRVSLIVLATMLFFRVVFRWNAGVGTPISDLTKSGVYWRWAWGAWCIGTAMVSFSHLASIFDQFAPVDRLGATLVGTSLLNLAAIMAEVGFVVGRGRDHGAIWPYAIMPFAFVAMALIP